MTCPDCHAPMIGVEYRGTSQDFDGVSEWRCPSTTCDVRIGRWSGKRLEPWLLEGRYGREYNSGRDSKAGR